MEARLKELVGQIPAAVALYDTLRPGRPRTRYNLEQLREALPKAVVEAMPHAGRAATGRRVILFATLHYWIEQAAIIGVVLRGMGHDVTLAYLPYSNWHKPVNQLDLQRQDRYTRRVLAPAQTLIDSVSLLDHGRDTELPEELAEAVARASDYDVMYSLQTEDINRASALYRLRLDRNRRACQAVLELLATRRADVAIIPNGLVTELGVFFQAAQYEDLHTVTYEFNDQREQVWIAQDDIVMHQNTDALWNSRGRIPLTDSERATIQAFETAREGARTFAKGTRLWQDRPSQGSEALRTLLGLDARPVVLLATNVLGDSLTLGRHVLASSMAEWIARTVSYFVSRTDVQLVVRIHPGERLIKGPSMRAVIEHAAPGNPEHIHIIGPEDQINTYDVIGLADLGLVYTTTVGMEMAMRGVPVIAAGMTHYRDRGFALGPSTWEEYFGMLGSLLEDPRAQRLTAAQIDAAWNYGYRFFFEYPHDFPWRLMHFWKDLDEWSVGRVLADEGRAAFGRSFALLSGEPIAW